MRFAILKYWPSLSLLAILWFADQAWPQGSVIGAVGPVNRSMAGAATAAPLDAMGALYWNPATLTGLDKSEMSFASALYYGTSRLSSSLPADAFAPGVPAVPLSGTTRGDG